MGNSYEMQHCRKQSKLTFFFQLQLTEYDRFGVYATATRKQQCLEPKNLNALLSLCKKQLLLANEIASHDTTKEPRDKANNSKTA